MTKSTSDIEPVVIVPTGKDDPHRDQSWEPVWELPGTPAPTPSVPLPGTEGTEASSGA